MFSLVGYHYRSGDYKQALVNWAEAATVLRGYRNHIRYDFKRWRVAPNPVEGFLVSWILTGI